MLYKTSLNKFLSIDIGLDLKRQTCSELDPDQHLVDLSSDEEDPLYVGYTPDERWMGEV